MPDDRLYHTLENSGLLCGGQYTKKTCLKWRNDIGTWEEILTLGMWRKGGHVSWTPDTGIGTYLIGGDLYEMTTTLIKPDGTQEQGFFLNHGIK